MKQNRVKDTWCLNQQINEKAHEIAHRCYEFSFANVRFCLSVDDCRFNKERRVVHSKLVQVQDQQQPNKVEYAAKNVTLLLSYNCSGRQHEKLNGRLRRYCEEAL